MEDRRTTTENGVSPVQDSDLIIDGALLGEVARRRLRSWLITGPVIFAVIIGYQLLFMPQSYTSTASISVQQGGGGGVSSPLALLMGSTPTKKYIGILHSRLLAEAVAAKFHLRQFYKLPSERRAVDHLMDNIRPEDSVAEGLLF